MALKHFQIVYDREVISHLKAIERKHHALIRVTIETHLAFEPDIEARNRKPLMRTTSFGARWELRFGEDNQFRVFYSLDLQRRVVYILAIGVKVRERLYIGGKEIE